MNRKKILILGILTALAILVIVIVSNQRSSATSVVYIKGLDECSKELDSSRLASIGEDLYVYVAAANSYNKDKSQPTYVGTVQKGTCQRKINTPVAGITGKKVAVSTTTATIAIADTQQSWRVTFDWVPKDSTVIDVGHLEASCPTNGAGPNCQKVVNIRKYGTPDYDPILEYMPYTGDGFDLSYSPDNKTVLATIIVPQDQKDNQELIQNNKEIVPYWFEKRGLDINKYSVVYRVLAN